MQSEIEPSACFLGSEPEEIFLSEPVHERLEGLKQMFRENRTLSSTPVQAQAERSLLSLLLPWVCLFAISLTHTDGFSKVLQGNVNHYLQLTPVPGV